MSSLGFLCCHRSTLTIAALQGTVEFTVFELLTFCTIAFQLIPKDAGFIP